MFCLRTEYKVREIRSTQSVEKSFSFQDVVLFGKIMSTNCEVSPDCFVHRMASLPMVSFTAHQALTAYEKTKNYNSLLAATLSAFENGFSFVANKAEPVYHKIEKPLMSASKVACVGLDKLETTVPSIKITPEELRDASLEYYNASYAKKGVDTINATKNYGAEKIEQTKELCRNTAKTAVNGTAAVVGIVRHPLLSVNSTLDYCDSMIDQYVAEGETYEPALDRDYWSVSCMEKVQLMSGKVANGVRIKTHRQMKSTKERVNKQMDSLKGALDLIEYARSTSDWAKTSAATNLEHLRENATALVRNIDAQAKKYNLAPDVLLLRWIKMTSSVTATLTNQLVTYGSAYLPMNFQKSLASMAHYVNEMNITFTEAENLGEIRGEFVSEAKEKLTVAQQKMVEALEHFADYPPVSWMKNFKNGEKREHHDLDDSMQNGVVPE